MAEPTSKSEIKSGLQQAQRAYIDQVARKLHLTVTEIARMGDIHPSTLTRFQNKPGYKGTLSPLTISMIAERSGVPAPQEAMAKPLTSQARVQQVFRFAGGPGNGLSDVEATPYEARPGDYFGPLVKAALAGRNHASPWTLKSRALEEEGYMPGDLLIVDLNAIAQPGDVVCAQIYDWERPNGTRTVFRLFQPPYLIGAGREEGARMPHLVDGRNVVVKGVVESSLRRRRAA